MTMLSKNADLLFKNINVQMIKIKSYRRLVQNYLDGASITEKNILRVAEIYTIIGFSLIKIQDLYIEFYRSNDFSYPDEFKIIDWRTSCFAGKLADSFDNVFKFYYENPKILTKNIVDDMTLVYFRCCYMGARWDIIKCMDLEDNVRPAKKKKLGKRLPALKELCFVFNRIIAVKLGIKFKDGFIPQKCVGAMPAGWGKTWGVNEYKRLLLTLSHIYSKETGLISMMNTVKRAQKQSGILRTLMSNKLQVLTYPEYERYVNKKLECEPFLINNQETVLLKDCDIESTETLFIRGNESSINGDRAPLGAVVDDGTGGMLTINSDEYHIEITERMIGELDDRSDEEDTPFIFIGTLHNENDIQNTLISMWESKYNIIKHPECKYVRYTDNGLYVIVQIPCFGEDGESLCPKLRTTQWLREKQDFYTSRGKAYIFDLMYLQKKASRIPCTFDYKFLKTYKELPDTLLETSISACDPNRRTGKDYFSMPILRFNPEDGLYYFTDCIFEQKALGTLDDPKNIFLKQVIKKLIDAQTTKLHIENNTSTTLGTLIQDKLKEKKSYCKITEKNTTKEKGYKNKTERILGREQAIMDNIVFPDYSIIQLNSAMYFFMTAFTKWDSKAKSGDNNRDDAPDSMSLWANEFLFQTSKSPLSQVNNDRRNDLKSF